MQMNKKDIPYLASRDGWSSAVFHEKCDGRKDLVILSSSSSPAHGGDGINQTHLFGAFTGIPMSSVGGFKNDPSSFLFSLRAGIPDPKFPKEVMKKKGEGPRYVLRPVRCGTSGKHSEFTVHHSSMVNEFEGGAFYGGGPMFGRGPDFLVDLDGPTR